MHATDFLDSDGRLGMIISNDWLQTDYGIKFANYLLNNYRIKAVLDFAGRLFAIPLIATTVILLEKEGQEKKRNENLAFFAYIDKETTVEELLSLIRSFAVPAEKLRTSVVRQGDLPRDRKWISVLFNTKSIEAAFSGSPRIVALEELFTPIRGTFHWTIETAGAGLGADKFFYLPSEDVQKWALQEYVAPVLTTLRYAKNFTFAKVDWEALKKRGKPCYVFLCHKPKSELPQKVKKYIEWGEKTPLVRPRKGERPKTASQSLPSRERQKNIKEYNGWYDLGERVSVPVFSTYRAQYVHRYGLLDFDVALDKDIFGLIPKTKTTSQYVKAELAYLNSDFTRLFIETSGRATGGGLIEFDINVANDLLILDLRRLTESEAEKLASLFDKLSTHARKLGGADTLENIVKLDPIVTEIDYEVANIIGLSKEVVELTRTLARALMERRLARITEARPEAVKGEEEPRIRPPRKPGRTTEKDPSLPLDRFI
jgi:hypothetical protein